MNGLTKAIALENAREKNFTCNLIAPGFVRTPLIEAQIELKRKEAAAEKKKEEDNDDDDDDDDASERAAIETLLGEKQPSLRFVETAEIAALVAHLCHPTLARSITGVAIPVDGGWTSQ